jgi:hypothetical protein
VWQADSEGYSRGLRVGLLEGASILNEVYVNHVYATGVSGLEARCKEAQQVLITKADEASHQPAAAPTLSPDAPDLREQWARVDAEIGGKAMHVAAFDDGVNCATPATPAIQQEGAALDERTAFEEWARNDYGLADGDLKIVHEDRYFWVTATNMWLAWQARAALTKGQK